MAASDEPVDDERVFDLCSDPAYQHPSGKPNATKIAQAMGKVDVRKALNRLARAGRFGTSPVLPGFGITQVSTQKRNGETVGESIQQRPESPPREIPPNFAISQITTYESSSGSSGVWTKAKPATLDPKVFAAELEAAFSNFTPATIPIPSPNGDFLDQLAVYPWSDPHLGLLTYGKEVGKNWDLKIGVRVHKETFGKVVARTPQTRKALLIIGGDTVHAQSNENRTPQSGNTLQVDGRYSKVLLVTCETCVDVASMLLQHHEEIEVIVLGGNHDPDASFAIAFFLHAWFRNEPRVKIDISPSLHRFREFGKVMIATTHGHTVKIKDFHAVMAATQPQMWGRTVHRFALGFHVHNDGKFRSERGGVISESFQVLVPVDAWHYGQGYCSGRSLQSIVYDREHGEVGRSRVTVV